jgi:hypothetical protein
LSAAWLRRWIVSPCTTNPIKLGKASNIDRQKLATQSRVCESSVCERAKQGLPTTIGMPKENEMDIPTKLALWMVIAVAVIPLAMLSGRAQASRMRDLREDLSHGRSRGYAVVGVVACLIIANHFFG